MSLSGYEAIHARLTEWVEQWHRERGPAWTLAKLNDYTGDAGEMVFINAETLWRVTSGFALLQITAEHAMSRIAEMEKETGREWYNRS